MPITFADLDLENQRQKLNSEQEKSHVQSRSNQQYPRRGTPGSHEAAGTATGNRGFRKKPNAFIIRQGAPAKDHHSLRNLSKCDLVQFTRRSEMLLQDYAYDHLERQRLKSDNQVRRKIFGLKKKREN